MSDRRICPKCETVVEDDGFPCTHCEAIEKENLPDPAVEKAMGPKPYDLTKPGESKRLVEELISYMKVSVNDGTDHEGRRYALEALPGLRPLLEQVETLKKYKSVQDQYPTMDAYIDAMNNLKKSFSEQVQAQAAEIERLKKGLDVGLGVVSMGRGTFEEKEVKLTQYQQAVKVLVEAVQKVHDDAEELSLKDLCQITHDALSNPAVIEATKKEVTSSAGNPSI